MLYNLSREFDKAEECFKRALELDPENYSLWSAFSSLAGCPHLLILIAAADKLGATQANSPKHNGSLEAGKPAL